MKHFYAVVALVATSAALFVAGCEQPAQEEVVEQTPPPAEPQRFDNSQIPYEPQPVEPAPSDTAVMAPPRDVPPADDEPVAALDNEPMTPPPPPPPRITEAKPRENYARPAEGKTYVVRKGDTLQKISKKFYGTTKGWRKIFEANRRVLKDPDKLQIGQKLVIP